MKPLLFCCALALMGRTVAAAENNPYHETQTPRRLMEWKDSGDGKVSVCFAVDKSTFSSKETISVRCAIRNKTDKPITILRPFGDSFFALSSGLTILGPEGVIPYRGAIKDYALGTGDFIELREHFVVEETIELPAEVLEGLGKPGLYSIGYRFVSGGYPKQPAPDNFWQGEVRTERLSILVK